MFAAFQSWIWRPPKKWIGTKSYYEIGAKTPHRYKTLPADHFRLLQIDNFETLNCSLAVSSMDNAPEYYAVSYTWGPPEDPDIDSDLGSRFPKGKQTIMLNGCATEVGQNLYDLLRQLRWESKGKWYWIDALCINQSDDNEKSEQVMSMARIYESARCVVVWLGKSTNNTVRTIEILNRLAAISVDENLIKDTAAFANQADPFDFITELGLGDVSTQDWLFLIRFLNREWFSRVWTLQEVAVASDIICYCGPCKFFWDTIHKSTVLIEATPLGDALNAILRSYNSQTQSLHLFTSVYMDMRGYVANAMTKLGNDLWFETWYGPLTSHSAAPGLLDKITFKVSNLKCSDPRDRVFALLGIMKKVCLTSHWNPPKIAIDYRKSVVDVYTETMAYIMKSLGSVTPLSRVNHAHRSEIKGLPSWVPDLSIEAIMPLLHVQRYSLGEEPFDASRQTKLGHFWIDGARLNLHIHKYACVTHIGENLDEMMTRGSFERSAELAVAYLNSNITEHVSIDNVWKTMLCDNLSMLEHKIHESDLRSAFGDMLLLISRLAWIMALGQRKKFSTFRNWQEKLANMDKTGTVPSPSAIETAGQLPSWDTLMNRSSLFQTMVSRTMTGRRLLLLETGEIGLCSSDVEPGDILCIVADGGRTPFVLQKVGSEPSTTWRLRGEAYVRRIMYGDAVSRGEDGNEYWEHACIV